MYKIFSFVRIFYNIKLFFFSGFFCQIEMPVQTKKIKKKQTNKTGIVWVLHLCSISILCALKAVSKQLYCEQKFMPLFLYTLIRFLALLKKKNVDSSEEIEDFKDQVKEEKIVRQLLDDMQNQRELGSSKKPKTKSQPVSLKSKQIQKRHSKKRANNNKFEFEDDEEDGDQGESEDFSDDLLICDNIQNEDVDQLE